MKTPLDKRAEIFRLRQVEHLKFVQIADAVGVCERTVRRIYNIGKPDYSEPAEYTMPSRPASRLAAQADLIKSLLLKYGYKPVVIYDRLRRMGVKTSHRSVQRWMQRHCKDLILKDPRVNHIYFEPGEAAQTDFGECGTLMYGGRERKLVFCVTVLCQSRFMYAEIIPSQQLEQFISCQRHAFEAFGGAPRKLIVDNCKCAVIRHEESEVVWNQAFLQFCEHYNVKPVACTPRLPRSKGLVERMVGYIKSRFLSANTFSGIGEANARLAEWLESTANARMHKVLRAVPADIFERLEKPALTSLPEHPHPCERVEERRLDKYGRISFDGNFYSVPPVQSSGTVTVKASQAELRIYCGGTLVATHNRTYDSGQELVDPRHVELARKALPPARLQDARRDFLNVGGQDAAVFLDELARRHGSVETGLLRLNAMMLKYGPEAFRQALHDAVAHSAFRTEYLEFLLTLPERIDEAAMHIPGADSQMAIRTPEIDLGIYKLEE